MTVSRAGVSEACPTVKLWKKQQEVEFVCRPSGETRGILYHNVYRIYIGEGKNMGVEILFC